MLITPLQLLGADKPLNPTLDNSDSVNQLLLSWPDEVWVSSPQENKQKNEANKQICFINLLLYYPPKIIKTDAIL